MSKSVRRKKRGQPNRLGCTVFLDRTHGKRLGAALRRLGYKVKSIYTVYPKKKHETTDDPTWIHRCAREKWVAISGDKRLETNPINKNAVIEAKCKVFILTDSNTHPEVWAAAIIVGSYQMKKFIENPGPFFVDIGKHAKSHIRKFRVPERDESASATESRVLEGATK
ncbi:MAG: hypothetical protein L0Z53_07360 [Acidobacteriales bacterium]|nr:hypothetical protein [Terriglobales bacterium]